MSRQLMSQRRARRSQNGSSARTRAWLSITITQISRQRNLGTTKAKRMMRKMSRRGLLKQVWLSGQLIIVSDVQFCASFSRRTSHRRCRRLVLSRRPRQRPLEVLRPRF